ncbi:SGNH/GDSL hydrolase family protein [Chitinophaga barathri]|uniref:SGNH/GDSL hydrolase family protein n=1 Tax=Chitinophaga barathri TaxID=1647451 RepID=A0A3N4MKX6_9BACT|nr:SGNH/GDSL hydrolase family protein [Chitinophaga barathri]
MALGDSYTIGEGVPLHESYPYQALQLLRANGHRFHAPEIIAKTGWTTDELISHLLHNTRLLPAYDYVTLLIGVNNQYRGMSETDYAVTFEWLAKKALELTVAKNITVLSIPDWGVTPFAKERDAAAIHDAIDRFNAINKKISADLGFNYVDITAVYRETGGRPESVVEDQLHPSGRVYAYWAEQVSGYLRG